MKNMKSGINTLVLLSCILVQNTFAQKAPTLRELIDSALVNDHHFENKQLEIESSRIDQQRLKDAYLPKIDISGKGGFLSSSFDLATPGIAIPQLHVGIPADENRYTLSSGIATANANASVLIYSGGKVPNLKKAVGQKVQAQMVMLEKDRQEIISQMLIAYDQLALLREVRLVLNESEKRLAENKRMADKAFGYGLITAYEQKKIELAQAQLNSKIKEYEGKRSLVLMQLHTLTTIDTIRLALLDTDLQVYKTTETTNTIANRPELSALESAIKANQFKVKAATSWWKPKVMASTSVGYLGLLNGHLSSRDPMMISGQRLSQNFSNINLFPVFNIGVGFKWDIFDGREGIHEVQKAKIELRMVENDKKEAEEKLSLNLQKTNMEYTIANEQLLVKHTARELARNAMKQASQEFKEGLIKSAQLLEAETDLQNASLEYAQAIFNQRRAASELLRATGSLTATSFQ